MQCNQLIRLIKGWYLNVKDETMAPARMMQFVDEHIKKCDVCHGELGLHREIEKIRAFVLPESKIPKAFREQDNTATPEISPVDDTNSEIDEDPEDSTVSNSRDN